MKPVSPSITTRINAPVALPPVVSTELFLELAQGKNLFEEARANLFHALYGVALPEDDNWPAFPGQVELAALLKQTDSLLALLALECASGTDTARDAIAVAIARRFALPEIAKIDPDLHLVAADLVDAFVGWRTGRVAAESYGGEWLNFTFGNAFQRHMDSSITYLIDALGVAGVDHYGLYGGSQPAEQWEAFGAWLHSGTDNDTLLTEVRDALALDNPDEENGIPALAWWQETLDLIEARYAREMADAHEPEIAALIRAALDNPSL